MGVVWLGWDAEFDRSLAIKVIKRFTATSAQRFEREAKAMMALLGNHAHCLSVHHVGLSHRTGEPFFSMHAPDPCRALRRRRPLPRRPPHPTATPIKPANILIDADNAHLTDFGVVSDLDTERLPLTRTWKRRDAKKIPPTVHESGGIRRSRRLNG